MCVTRIVLVVATVAAGIAAAAASASPAPGFLGCFAYAKPSHSLLVRPTRIQAACGDGNFYFATLKWSTWAGTSAHATGTAHQNDCTPYCAAGHFHAYPARVTLSAVKACHGKREFTKLAWTLTAAKPKGIARSSSETFRCA